MCNGESVHERALCLALLGNNVGNHLLRHCIAHPAGREECQVYWYWHIMLLFFKRARVQSGRAVAVQ